MRIETTYSVIAADGLCVLETPSWRAALAEVENIGGSDLDADTNAGIGLLLAVSPCLWVEHPGPMDGDCIRFNDAETGEPVATIEILWAVEGEDLEPSGDHCDRDGLPIWGLPAEITGPGEDCCDGAGCGECSCGF